MIDKIVLKVKYFWVLQKNYHRIRGVSNMQSKQSREILMPRRTSLVGLSHIPMLVSTLNSTIVSYFKDDFNNLLHANDPASCKLVPTTTNLL
jgi:hypothetical protein